MNHVIYCVVTAQQPAATSAIATMMAAMYCTAAVFQSCISCFESCFILLLLLLIVHTYYEYCCYVLCILIALHVNRAIDAIADRLFTTKQLAKRSHTTQDDIYFINHKLTLSSGWCCDIFACIIERNLLNEHCWIGQWLVVKLSPVIIWTDFIFSLLLSERNMHENVACHRQNNDDVAMLIIYDHWPGPLVVGTFID